MNLDEALKDMPPIPDDEEVPDFGQMMDEREAKALKEWEARQDQKQSSTSKTR